MESTPISRRTFVSGAVAAASTQTPPRQSEPKPDAVGAKKFMAQWDLAWANHDADAMASLLTDDAVTVNRFGTLLSGREATRNALAFLHGASGPFVHSHFPPLAILSLRRIAEGVMALQASWQNPVVNPDGKGDSTKTNDMIVTFVLVRGGQQWQAAQMDLHNVETMNLPFSQPNQKK